MQQACSFRRSMRYTQHDVAKPKSVTAVKCLGLIRQLQHRPYQQHVTQPSTACRARLPHMDEEMEHMQWQLDKRAHEDSADKQRGSNGSGRHSAKAGRGRGQQHVFHERHSNGHRRHSHRQPHHHRHGSRSASEGEQGSFPQPAVATALSTSTAGESAITSVSLAGDVQDEPAAQQQQQQQQQPPFAQYYHLQLQDSAAGADLPKARDRLLKHILQDGGCYVCLSAALADALSHLLLFLQQRQVQEQQGRLLLLQPAGHEWPQAPAAAPAVGAAGNSRSGGGSGSSTVVVPGGQQRPLAGSCSIDELKFWTTVVPLEVLLGTLQPQQQQFEEAAGSAAAAPSSNSSSSSSSSRAITASSTSHMDGISPFSVESSTEEWQMPTRVSSSSGRVTVAVSSNTSSSSNSTSAIAAASSTRRRDSSSYSSTLAEAALLDAAGRSCSATGTLLLAAVAQQRLQCVRVGSHADPLSVCGSVMQAVTAGKVGALHVKGSSAAHTAAYTALELAAGQLLAVNHPHGLGILLVPGRTHEHVHAVPQGHTAPAVADTAAHRAGEQHHHHHGSSRVHSDASMAVGSFGAAFYGVGDSSGGRAGEHWLQHRHAQEMWLCVVPLALAE